jgi:hypothetical protein
MSFWSSRNNYLWPISLAFSQQVVTLYGPHILIFCTQISRIIREIQLERTLWLDILVRMREVDNQPLPLSNPAALDLLSLPGIQTAVRHAYRLMINWRSDTPQPVRIQTFAIE